MTCCFFKWTHHSINHSSFFLFFNLEMRTVIQNTEQPVNLAPLTSTLSTSFPGWTSQESCFRELRSPSAVEMLFPCKNPPVLSLLLSSSWEASHLCKLWKAIDKRKGMTFAIPSVFCACSMKCEFIWEFLCQLHWWFVSTESFSFRVGKNWGGDPGSPVLLFSRLPVSSSGNIFFS